MDNIDLNSAIFVGVDIHSQNHTAVAATRLEEEKGRLQFANNNEGIIHFLTWLKLFDNKPLIIGIEGSGGNGEKLTSTLVKEYQHIYEVNPLYTKARRTFGTKRDKSDIRDAKLIVEVLTRKLPELPQLNQQQLSDAILTLKTIVSWYDGLVYQRTRLKNQLHTYLGREGEHSIHFSHKYLSQWKKQHLRSTARTLKDKMTREVIKETITELERITFRCSQVKKKIEEILSQTHYQHLTSIKGIDAVLTAQIIAETEGLERFSNIDQFIKYAGIAPVEKASGKKVRFVQSKDGNRKLNSALYLVALNQLRWNQKAKAYFAKKIAEGKSKKHALRCLMKRVACIVYGVLKSGKSYRG